MSKRNHRHKKTVSAIEKERRKILAQKRKERKKLEKRRCIKEFIAIAVLCILIFAVIILSAVSDIFLILLLAIIIIFIFICDKSGIRAFVFSNYPDSFPFAESLKKYNPDRALPMELASTLSYYALILIIFENKFSFIWTIIWLVCIITGWYYILTDSSEKYSLEKGAEFENSTLFILITPIWVLLENLRNVRINHNIVLFTVICCLIITFIYTVSHKGNFSRTSLVFIFSAVCAFSGFLSINKNFDFSQPKEITLVIQDKDISRGKSSSYYIYTSDWQNPDELIDIQVNYDIYNNLENGDKVTIEIYNGSLGIEHYHYKEKASVN